MCDTECFEIMYRVVRNGFRKMSILWVNFTTEDGF